MTRLRNRPWITRGGVVGSREIGIIKAPDIINTARCVDELHAGPPFRSGGPLLITKRSSFRQWSRQYSSHPPFTSSFYDGKFYSTIPTEANRSPTDLTVWGTRGWTRALPVHDLAGLARFVGEMKDAPRMIEDTALFFANFKARRFGNRSRSYWGDAYLNNVFGWLPFIQDLTQILHLGLRVDQEIARLRRLDAHPVHRRFVMLDEAYSINLQTVRSVGGGVAPGLSSECYYSASDPRCEFSDRLDVRRVISFEGKFRALISTLSLNSPRFRSHLIGELTGALPDMYTVYQLMPWSWLLDWFVNAGEILKNATLMAKYHQIADYAYVMCEESYTTVRKCSTVINEGNYHSGQLHPSPVVLEGRYIQTFKQRVAASPYGFGLSWQGFSPYQIAVLAALGLSRSERF